MKDLTKVFIDLSKLSEEGQKDIISLLPEPAYPFQYRIDDDDNYILHFLGNKWWVINYGFEYKQELTYLEFIKLFEGGGTIKSENTQTLQNALKQIKKLESDKAEILEALEDVKPELRYFPEKLAEIEFLIQKMKQ